MGMEQNVDCIVHPAIIVQGVMLLISNLKPVRALVFKNILFVKLET